MTGPLIHSLEARYYTDPEIYKKEKEGLFAKTWQYAGHISHLKDIGSYFTFEIAGESLFCIKGRDGIVRTF